MITTNAHEKIRHFNKIGLHYNLVADAVYGARDSIGDPFSMEYMPYITAGLVSFDMSRMMGADSKSRYDREAGGFAALLEKKIEAIRPYISHLVNTRIDKADLQSEKENIKKAYVVLSSAGKDGLNQRGNSNHFHVGATKILHFINPYVFIIIDSNASRAFKKAHNVGFLGTTQPGYSSDKYIECMECAKIDILEYGIDDFMAIEEGTPIARIYDKLTFITGSESL